MARRPHEPTRRAIQLIATVGRAVRAIVALALPVVIIGGLMFVRAGGLTTARDGVSGPVVEITAGATAPSRLAAAATAIKSALGKGGGGITFEIVQTQTIKARPGGPQLAIPDPNDPTKSLGWTDTEFVGTLIERGFATPAGFWSELIHGPDPGAEAAFDLAKADPARKALVRDGKRYRDDGAGWYEATVLPGIGLDPETVARLPVLLGDTGDATQVALAPDPDPALAVPGLVGPAQPVTAAIDATSRVENVPGVVAADLAPATVFLAPTEFGLDSAGRLVSLRLLARNTNMELYDLVVKTVVTFRYPSAPPALPEPLPAYVEPTPASDGE